ncbi:hypothetical protein ENTCAN_07879 [Enterobacter cancerogenus ATCC 35316]|nr:hypothetical protein ENTCAN_07879 [Enterobacter cancerogenus ATCC 35316]
MTFPVSRFSHSDGMTSPESNCAKYIEYFIASNCYALPFRIRLSNTLLFSRERSGYAFRDDERTPLILGG